MELSPDEKVRMDLGAFLSAWQELATAKGFQTESLTEVGGFPLLASSKGGRKGCEKPTFYLSAGMHGDEPAGPQALLALLEEDFFDDRFHWLICPLLNPTGMARGTRENEEGVDLNRDYCLKNTEEVRAHVEWLERQEVPEAFLSLHEDWESSGFYFYEINLRGEGDWYARMMTAAAPYFPAEPEALIDGHKVTELGWICHSEHPDLPEGWPEAIFMAKRGCPLSLTFETPSSAVLSTRVSCQQALVRDVVKWWVL